MKNLECEKENSKKYEKISKIGYGAFGCVYKVKSIQDGKFYALKKFFLDNVI